jgi:hypothetical protein
VASVKLFVGAWNERTALILFTSGELVDGDLLRFTRRTSAGEFLPTVDRFFDAVAVDSDVPADGLWVFEGVRRYQGNTTTGYDVRYNGVWRRPTDAEAIAAACGENPCLAPCGAPGDGGVE